MIRASNDGLALFDAAIDWADTLRSDEDADFNLDEVADGDGVVDGDDFLIWQTQFAPGDGSGSGAVPEPSTFGLLLLAGLALAAVRKRLV